MKTLMSHIQDLNETDVAKRFASRYITHATDNYSNSELDTLRLKPIPHVHSK